MATATQVKNNFGKYLEQAKKGNDVIIIKNGKEVTRQRGLRPITL
jgi:prevent-host-death family protein